MNIHLDFLTQIPIKNKTKYSFGIDAYGVKFKLGTDCSGIEAPIHALNYLGIKYEHIFSCDNDKDIKETILANYKPKYFYDNIFGRNYDKMPDIDIYICGFPCQSFSTGGNREGFFKSNSDEGLIFFECLNVIKYKKPIFFILENVKGLIRHENGNTFKIILDELKKLGNYNIYYNILRTSDYNIPQKRDRIYIIGINKEYQNKKFRFPKKINPTIDLDDILETKKYSKIPILTENKIEIVNKKIENYNIEPEENYAINLNASYPYATTCKDLSPCLLTTCNMIYLTKYNRFLTIRECLRLQGFPENFKPISQSINKIYKQIGNSMSVNVLCFLFLEIFKSLD
jgi:DNA (cytosine-5)-methyltransferase 1